LFGAGLARPLEGAALATVKEIERRGLPVVAVDVPSGLHGDTGQVLGAAPRAVLTVTFFRRKPGHVLLPGRDLCGEVVVADIGTPIDVLDQIRPQTFVNGPPLWLDCFPWPRSSGHKYQRGHALIVGGAKMTGAARLAARAAARTTGVVTVACPPQAMPIYAVSLLGILIDPVESSAQFSALLEDARKTAVLVGPGNGVGERTRACAMAALKSGKPCALDADVFTSFADNPPAFISALSAAGTRCVLTPHEGEFARIFDLAGDKLTRARAAAKLCGQVVLIKGGDTVIAAPDGRAIINANAPTDLATAGAGDVLAGILTGLLASAVPVFEAACAAVWLHGAAAKVIGPGLVAEDLETALPEVLRGLRVAAGIP
jgi:ADP-dependent NAD(P)H-hydrate dehydratase / NAD(P)H-hydrate epimerase